METKVFGSHKGMPNSHTLKVGVFDLPMVEYVGMRCIYCGYGKGTAGDSNNWISYNTKFPKEKVREKALLIFWIFNSHIGSTLLQHLGGVGFHKLQTLTLSHLTPTPIYMAYVSWPFDTNCNAPILMPTILSVLGPMPLMALFFFQAQRWIFNPYTRSSLLHTQVM